MSKRMTGMGENGRRRGRLLRRLAILIAGTVVLLTGLAISPLPGPGLTILGPLGLAILATEFLWARRLLSHVSKQERGIRDIADRVLVRVSRLFVIPLMLAFWGSAWVMIESALVPDWLAWSGAFMLFMPVSYLVYRLVLVRGRRSASRRLARVEPPPTRRAA